MARGSKWSPERAGTMSFPKAMATGAGYLAFGLVMAMLLPLAYDIYRTGKTWLLKEAQPPL